VAAVAKRLGASTVAAAEGIQRVVNTNMTEGIRLVSVRRGADPRRFALLAFGGAAGLHVTEVARMLEISRVVVPRVAAVLSAWGMLTTDLRHELVRTHVGEAHKVGGARLRKLFGEMEADGRERLGTDFAGRVRVTYAVDMRYGEQTFEITVPLPGVDIDAPDLMDQVVERFHRRHEELYTYSAPGQDVVLVNARVAVIGELPGLPAEQSSGGGGDTQPKSRRVYIGRWMEVPVYDLESVRAGLEVKGPAIFESSTTTVVLRQDERAVVTPLGWLDIQLS
jgi:N-methylhydantoinase A